MAAQNPALTQLLTTLNAAPHPNMGTDFFAHVGSHMRKPVRLPRPYPGFPVLPLRFFTCTNALLR